jgi:uncharacterized lipoprotein YehR (DUF1307 family)
MLTDANEALLKMLQDTEQEYIKLNGEFLLQQQDAHRQEQARVDEQKAASEDLATRRLLWM